MSLPSNIVDICNRIQRGDGTTGWSGDGRMYVVFDYVRERYAVMRACEDGVDRLINSWPPREFDARVLKYLAEHDSRRHDVLARVEKHNQQLEASREAEARELEKALNADIQWMARKLYLPGTDPAPYRG